jgi:GATA-binding protein
MKKTIIKRRKRVVAPANGNFTPSPAPAPQSVDSVRLHTAQHHIHMNGSQVDAEMSDLNSLQASSSNQDQRHFPPPVDFTTFRSGNQDSTTPVASMQNPTAPPFENSNAQQRKRSLSQTMDVDSPEGRGHSSIRSILNRQNGSGEVPIEPSLLALGGGSGSAADMPAEERRRQLGERRNLIEKEMKRLQGELEICSLEIERCDAIITESTAISTARAVRAVAET